MIGFLNRQWASPSIGEQLICKGTDKLLSLCACCKRLTYDKPAICKSIQGSERSTLLGAPSVILTSCQRME